MSFEFNPQFNFFVAQSVDQVDSAAPTEEILFDDDNVSAGVHLLHISTKVYRLVVVMRQIVNQRQIVRLVRDIIM